MGWSIALEVLRGLTTLAFATGLTAKARQLADRAERQGWAVKTADMLTLT